MELKDQVCSFENAKKLKELGEAQESYAYWHKLKFIGAKNCCRCVNNKSSLLDYPNRAEIEREEVFAAFTVIELGEMLPRYIIEDGKTHELEIVRSSVWRFYYGKDICYTAMTDSTEADARAEFLIYLIENGYVKTDEPDEEKPEIKAEERADEKRSVGLEPPQTFGQAVNQMYDQMKAELRKIKEIDAEDITVDAHHGFGTSVRNSWGLWEENELTRDFNSRGIFHADDMSSLIMKAAVAKLEGRAAFDFNKEAVMYWRHWIQHSPDNLGKKTIEYLKSNNLMHLVNGENDG